MPKKLTTSKAKARAWKWCSLYIRARDSYQGHAPCCTCGRVLPIAGAGCIHAGHFIPGRTNALLYNEKNIHTQCLTEESSLLLSSGKYKPISEIESGDELSAFCNKSFVKKLAVVQSTKSFIPDELFQVTMENGSVFYATPDHQVVSNNKWVRVDEVLHDVSAYDILQSNQINGE